MQKKNKKKTIHFISPAGTFITSRVSSIGHDTIYDAQELMGVRNDSLSSTHKPWYIANTGLSRWRVWAVLRRTTIRNPLPDHYFACLTNSHQSSEILHLLLTPTKESAIKKKRLNEDSWGIVKFSIFFFDIFKRIILLK